MRKSRVKLKSFQSYWLMGTACAAFQSSRVWPLCKKYYNEYKVQYEYSQRNCLDAGNDNLGIIIVILHFHGIQPFYLLAFQLVGTPLSLVSVSKSQAVPNSLYILITCFLKRTTERQTLLSRYRTLSVTLFLVLLCFSFFYYYK